MEMACKWKLLRRVFIIHSGTTIIRIIVNTIQLSEPTKYFLGTGTTHLIGHEHNIIIQDTELLVPFLRFTLT